ncbi:hypothetical protein CAOG_02084 [Capsaspora owczarzaki ATCC 30864]|uniref:J domain-containing protein n=1 Tax=Capsaspora owczarzaki (strain ATCC 30864) TaxID=595528 RepID=A0A0D2VL60_CAPO3|nr:hypothetical protein CAOG_02084 [Capsaspora owczarzaki ATCC 30864]KJE90842.1 hypothetical protein CAOG_002084 [Capsaspora owczarzaki ATCC 30864]|eukprot:XP_004348834.2 hypothetical protein CAOG_02084 [Capsaspora owczarzaki ATCC 30864]
MLLQLLKSRPPPLSTLANSIPFASSLASSSSSSSSSLSLTVPSMRSTATAATRAMQTRAAAAIASSRDCHCSPAARASSCYYTQAPSIQPHYALTRAERRRSACSASTRDFHLHAPSVASTSGQPGQTTARQAAGDASKTPSKSNGHSCWSCPGLLAKNDLFCHSCSVIAPPALSGTYFDLFGLPVSFDLDTANLERLFRQLQWKLHPDRFSQKSPTEQEYSTHHSSTVNKAYDVLKVPLKRAQYLLHLKGIEIEERSTADLQMPELLMEVMELNERIDQAQSEAEVKEIAADIEDQLQHGLRELSSAFKAEKYDVAKQWTIILKYYYNLQQAAHNWGDSRGRVVH